MGRSPHLLLAWLLLLLGSVPAGAAEPAVREYQVKAAFLFNFAQFTEWPAAAFADADTPLRIGVLGDDPFGAALDETVRDETVRGRRITVQRARRVEELKGCQLVFVCRSEKDRLPEIVTALGGQAVLTTSDIDGFAGHGGVIGFQLEGRKVRFAIDPAAAEHQHLRLSAQLLRLGRTVDGAKGGG